MKAIELPNCASLAKWEKKKKKTIFNIGYTATWAGMIPAREPGVFVQNQVAHVVVAPVVLCEQSPLGYAVDCVGIRQRDRMSLSTRKHSTRTCMTSSLFTTGAL